MTLQSKTDLVSTDYQYIANHRRIWQQKPILRRLYGEQFYGRLLKHVGAGKNHVEIGSGPGIMAEFNSHIIRTDILSHPFINLTVDAHHLPFANESIDTVVGLDVLHHFNQPTTVMREVNRVLRVGGKFALVEPYITPFSRLIYTYFHQEDCDLSINPWEESNHFNPNKKAFDGNAAIPYLLVKNNQNVLKSLLPSLELIHVQKFSLFTYLLSGGFKPFCLLPTWIYPILQKMEDLTAPFWRDVAALRALLVWEKRR